MRAPSGHSSEKIEKVMLLSMWANHLKSRNKSFISAGIGKPTYPVHQETINSYRNYWKSIQTHVDHFVTYKEEKNEACAIGYGDPHDDIIAKTTMSKAMSEWYKTNISPGNILFTVGGISGLKLIFDVLNSLYGQHGKYRTITPFPHYSAYANNQGHILHPIDVMKEKGYQLTAVALEASIQSALSLSKLDGAEPRAILICNPSNPLGTIISEHELKKIASVLRRYPNLHIILDEAYAEMNYIDLPSLITLAPDLKKRTLLLRSATKALSAAGERMAILISFDDDFTNELVTQKIFSYIHAPRSAQIAYAQTMLRFTDKDREAMIQFYKEKVDYVTYRLIEMGASMPCPDYRVEATFYALGDFSELIGMPIPLEAKVALEKEGEIKGGEDLAYMLMFQHKLMLTPLCYFGLPKESGYLRITCSASFDELKTMMDRLENALKLARKLKQSVQFS